MPKRDRDKRTSGLRPGVGGGRGGAKRRAGGWRMGTSRHRPLSPRRRRLHLTRGSRCANSRSSRSPDGLATHLRARHHRRRLLTPPHTAAVPADPRPSTSKWRKRTSGRWTASGRVAPREATLSCVRDAMSRADLDPVSGPPCSEPHNRKPGLMASSRRDLPEVRSGPHQHSSSPPPATLPRSLADRRSRRCMRPALMDQ